MRGIDLMVQCIVGLVIFTFTAWLLSESRGKVAARGIVIGIGLQFFIAALLLKAPFFQEVFL
ncbi:MAG: Na+ dependent nucleoside transporter N-terminal domain-containing protein, partial [bacterium]